MHIEPTPIKNDGISIANRTLLSRSKSGIGALIQRVSNAALWRDPYCTTGFACGTLISFAAYAGSKAISSAVNDINDLLAPCESQSPQIFREVMRAGLKYGLSGGGITGLGIAALIRRSINIIHGTDQSMWQLLGMGASIGLSFSGITGMLYSVYLQQVHNVNHVDCYGIPPIIINERSFNM